MELEVYQQDGSEAGRTVALDASVFDITPNDHTIWLDVRRIQANGRQGTHHAKERNEVVGSRRKLYRQKGTGFARAGDAKSPIRRSGGVAFGPSPRKYGLNLNKKTRQLARRSALTYKAREEALRIVEDFSLEAPSTSTVTGLLSRLGLTDQKVFFLTAEYEPALYRSVHNLPKVKVEEARNASTYDLLNAEVVLLQEGGLDHLTRLLGQEDAVVTE